MFQVASLLVSLFVGPAHAKDAAPVRVSANQPQTATAPAPSQNGAQ